MAVCCHARQEFKKETQFMELSNFIVRHWIFLHKYLYNHFAICIKFWNLFSQFALHILWFCKQQVTEFNSRFTLYLLWFPRLFDLFCIHSDISNILNLHMIFALTRTCPLRSVPPLRTNPYKWNRTGTCPHLPGTNDRTSSVADSFPVGIF